MKHLSLIVAMGENGVIGKNNQLLWHLPNDLKHFKALTTGKSVIMGRKTFESIGKPLPNRQNIVLTQGDFQTEGVDVAHSLEEALAKATSNEIMIMGGAQIYRLFLPLVSKMYITFVQVSVEGDVYFPEFDHSQWREVDSEMHQKDEKHGFDYRFVTWVRI